MQKYVDEKTKRKYISGEKYKLNLKEIDEKFQSSKFLNAVTFTSKTAMGAAGGLGTGTWIFGIVAAVLAVYGITVAVVFETIAAAVGAGIIGALTAIPVAYQMWKD